MQRFRQAATKKLQVPDAVCSKKFKFQNPYVVNLSESQKILALVIFSKHRAEFPTGDFRKCFARTGRLPNDCAA